MNNSPAGSNNYFAPWNQEAFRPAHSPQKVWVPIVDADGVCIALTMIIVQEQVYNEYEVLDMDKALIEEHDGFDLMVSELENNFGQNTTVTW